VVGFKVFNDLKVLEEEPTQKNQKEKTRKEPTFRE